MSTNDKALIKASKYMALLLRHDPAAGGLTLDAEGWTPVSDLLRALGAKGHALSREDLFGLVEADAKGRYALGAHRTRIRANQGHSNEGVRVTLREAEPPAVLYHGTVSRSLDAIFREGLSKMQRHHVHLSPDVETATIVAARRGTPVILKIDAARMRADGVTFWMSENGVWLTDHVAPGYLSL